MCNQTGHDKRNCPTLLDAAVMNITPASLPPSIQDMVPNLVAQVQQLQLELSKVNSVALFHEAMSVLNEGKDIQALEAENARLCQQVADHILIDPKAVLWQCIGKDQVGPWGDSLMGQLIGELRWDAFVDEHWDDFVAQFQQTFIEEASDAAREMFCHYCDDLTFEDCFRDLQLTGVEAEQ